MLPVKNQIFDILSHSTAETPAGADKPALGGEEGGTSPAAEAEAVGGWPFR